METIIKCAVFQLMICFHIVHQILVHLGLLTKESGFKIAENAFSGGPLGELVQWSDLITTLYLLGHDVRISASLAELKESVPNTSSTMICLKLSFKCEGNVPESSRVNHALFQNI